MVSYKLYYFDCRARAECMRMMFKAAEVDFEEVNWVMSEWATWKPKAPTGGSPWLEIDGVAYSQTVALERYVAQEHGFLGKTKFDALRCDMIVECIREPYEAHIRWFAGNKGFPGFLHGEELAEYFKGFKEKTLPGALGTLEKLAAGGGHFVGESMTWPDIRFHTFMDWIHNEVSIDILDNYPKLKGIHATVEANPRIAEHNKNRKPHLTGFGY